MIDIVCISSFDLNIIYTSFTKRLCIYNTQRPARQSDITVKTIEAFELLLIILILASIDFGSYISLPCRPPITIVALLLQ